MLTPTIYEQALVGEALPRIVETRSPFSLLRDDIVVIGDWQIRIPELAPTPVPQSQRFISEIRSRTGWSVRRLAEILGTSHTTIRRIENGSRPQAGHSGSLRERLANTHDLVARAYALAGGDFDSAARLLEERAPSGHSAIEHLRNDEPSLAYLAMIDVAAPRPQGLLVGTRPREAGGTSPLHD